MHEYRISNANLDLDVIADSGQCFRMQRCVRTDGSKYFNVIARDKFIRMEDKGDVYTFKCEESDLPFWIHYFDLNTNYNEFREVIQHSDDDFLKSALTFGKGMRILRQDHWEAAISFIISQNNNIPRIKKSIEAICQKFGHLIVYEGEKFYSFPTQEDMQDATLEALQGMGLGYRDKYILNACKGDSSILSSDRSTLLTISGIGPKVASCILLYGHHRLDEYPIDTWMKRLINDVYHGNFDSTIYYDFRGYVQQLQFYYYRYLKGRKI